MTKHQEAIQTLQEEPPMQMPAAQPGTALEVVDFGADAGQGLENISNAERSIPIFRILQGLSPQVKDPQDGGIPGAKPGKIFNIATGELFDGRAGIPFIPVARDHNYPEWTPRLAGGGFVAIHAPDEPIIQQMRAAQGQFGKLSTATRWNERREALDGTEFVETYYLYGLATMDYLPALLAFSSTGIKQYKNFINRVTNFKYKSPHEGQPPVLPPIYAHQWLLQTALEKNKKGEFYTFRLSLAAKNEDGTEAPYIKSLIKRSDPLYAQAKAFSESIAEGKAKVDYAATREPGADEGAENEVPM